MRIHASSQRIPNAAAEDMSLDAPGWNRDNQMIALSI
jgi:hypothetical protein